MKNLNVLNGESLKEYFSKNFSAIEEHIISFNECLVDGELHKEIFSEEFFSIRKNFITKCYQVSEEIYNEKAGELKPLLNNTYDKITLWFDFDMFCQINMLTILAYLDYKHFKGAVTVNIIKQDFFYCSSFSEIVEEKIELDSLENFYDLYLAILIERDFEKISSKQYSDIFKKLPQLKEGTKLYINYKSTNNEIIDFINERKSKNRYEILKDLIKYLNKYGLGDIQYMKILDEIGIN
jgi:hypothetical protein